MYRQGDETRRDRANIKASVKWQTKQEDYSKNERSRSVKETTKARTLQAMFDADASAHG